MWKHEEYFFQRRTSYFGESLTSLYRSTGPTTNSMKLSRGPLNFWHNNLTSLNQGKSSICPSQIHAPLPNFWVKSDWNHENMSDFFPIIKHETISRWCLQKALLDTTQEALLRKSHLFPLHGSPDIRLQISLQTDSLKHQSICSPLRTRIVTTDVNETRSMLNGLLDQVLVHSWLPISST